MQSNTSTAYAIYLRKSRADQEAEARGEGETLSRHLSMLEALAKRNQHPIVQIYREIISGESIADRPQMQQLLRDVGAGKYTGVYVTEVERLARGDTSDQGTVAKTFLYSQTKIITLTKTYDPSSEFDNEYFEFNLFMSRREYKTINRRIQAGRMQSLSEGRYICSRPTYGYRKTKIPDAKGYMLVPEPEEAAVVERIFRQYANTADGLVRIAAQLTAEHVPVGLYGKAWTECRLYRMLSNEVYIGKIRWGHNKAIPKIEDGIVTKKRALQKDYTLIDGLHKPIVDEELFAAVQRKLHAPRTIPHNDGKHRSNPLSGLLYCSECGHVMRALPASGRQPARLFCHTRGCPTVSTNRIPVEEAILAVLSTWMEQTEVGKAPPSQPGENQIQNTIHNLELEQKQLYLQRDNLYDLVERGTYTDEVFNNRFIALSERLKQVEDDLAQTKAAANTRFIPINSLHDTIHNLLAVYESADALEKNRLLKEYISKVVYRKTEKGNIIKGRILSAPDAFELEVYPRLLGREK